MDMESIKKKIIENNKEIKKDKNIYKNIISKSSNYIFFYKFIILVLIIFVTIYLNLSLKNIKYIKYLIIILIIIILLIDTLLIEQFYATEDFTDLTDLTASCKWKPVVNLNNKNCDNLGIISFQQIEHDYIPKLKKELIHTNNLKNKIKKLILEIKMLDNNTDLINILIYLVIISLIANVVYVDLNLEYYKVLFLFIIMFLLGFGVYLFRYVIKVRSNPMKKYF